MEAKTPKVALGNAAGRVRCSETAAANRVHSRIVDTPGYVWSVKQFRGRDLTLFSHLTLGYSWEF